MFIEVSGDIFGEMYTNIYSPQTKNDRPTKTVVLNLPKAVTFTTVPYVVTPNHKFLLLLHNCKFATVVNHNVSICFLMVLGHPYERVIQPKRD